MQGDMGGIDIIVTNDSNVDGERRVAVEPDSSFGPTLASGAQNSVHMAGDLE